MDETFHLFSLEPCSPHVSPHMRSTTASPCMFLGTTYNRNTPLLFLIPCSFPLLPLLHAFKLSCCYSLQEQAPELLQEVRLPRPHLQVSSHQLVHLPSLAINLSNFPHLPSTCPTS